MKKKEEEKKTLSHLLTVLCHSSVSFQFFLRHIVPITRHCHANNLPSTEQAVKLNQNKIISLFLSFFVVSDRLSVVSFCGLIKGISPKICVLCVRVKINKFV